MFKNKNKDELITDYFNTSPQTLLTDHSLVEFISNGLFDFENNLENTQHESDLTFDEIVSVELTIGHVKNVLSDSHMELPEKIKVKEAVVNPQNKTDNKCLIWCLVMSKYYKKIS